MRLINHGLIYFHKHTYFDFSYALPQVYYNGFAQISILSNLIYHL